MILAKVFFGYVSGDIGSGEGVAMELQKQINEWLLDEQPKSIEKIEQTDVPSARGVFLTVFYTETLEGSVSRRRRTEP